MIPMVPILLYIILGIVTGILSGLIGIGGGVILIPALVYLFGLSQQQAQGTTLAMFALPIGIISAWAYHKQGFVDVKIALFICIGFLAGSLLGSHLAFNVPTKFLSRLLGVIMLFLAAKMLVSK